MKKSLKRYALLALVLMMTTSTLTACRTTGPKKWWQFWKRSTPRMFPEVPEAGLPAPEGGTVGGSSQVTPGGLAEAAGDRSANLSEVAELQTIYFDYDSPNLSSEMQSRLEQNAAWIKSNPNVTVQIGGHCDERGTVEYNMNLGQKRADVVREKLAAMGIDSSRLVTISYGENQPVDPGHDESAYAKNRRVQFLVY